MRRNLLSLSVAIVLSAAHSPPRALGHDHPPAAAAAPHAPTQNEASPTNELERHSPSVPDADATSNPGDKNSIPLAPRRVQNRKRPANARAQMNLHLELRPLATAAASLGMVLGLFFIGAWALRRSLPAASSPLPPEVFEVLGRAPLAGKQQVYLTRLANKLLLICLTPTGPCSLGEIDQPEEVDRIAGLCAQHRPHSSTATFRQALAEASRPNPSSRRLPSGGGRHV